MNPFFVVATAVPKLKVADVRYNVGQIGALIAKEKRAALLVFPELSLTGYTANDLFGQESLLEECESGLLSLAKETQNKDGFLAVVGLPFRYRNALYNVAAVLGGGKVLGLVPKSAIPTYSEFYEGRWFQSGKEIRNTEVGIGGETVPFGTDLLFADEKSQAVLGIEICEDLWAPVKPSTGLALAGANLLVNLSGSDEVIGKEDYRRMLVESQSGSTYSAYLYVSSGVYESSTDLVFSGASLIAQNGSLLSEEIFPKSYPSLHYAVIDLEKSLHDRRHMSSYGRSPEGYRRVPVSLLPLGGLSPIVEESLALLRREGYTVSPTPFVPKDEDLLSRRAEKILQIQANGLATRVRSTGLYSLVLGISGGLDSTLALLVAAEARKIEPKIRILAYTMPNEGNTTSRTYQNAKKLMEELPADEIHEVPIARSVAQHLLDIHHPLDYQGSGDTAYENAQARMRTYILMDVSNMVHGLVVGTGDLSELALGWCTYNGDHMSMYGVNASVPKTLVRYLVRSYALRCTDPKLKETLLSIVETPITPELTPSRDGTIGQKTEEEIGPYDLNDFFLYHFLRYGKSPKEILTLILLAFPSLSKEKAKEALRNFYVRFFRQQFKRSCLPDGPKVGSVSLSPRGDWRMPSDASPDTLLEELKAL